MHTFTEDVGNKVLVNQTVWCVCYHVQVYLRQSDDFDSLNSTSNVLPYLKCEDLIR
jgi:hypothetical protein